MPKNDDFEIKMHRLKGLAESTDTDELFASEYHDRVTELCADAKAGEVDQAEFLLRSMRLRFVLLDQMAYMTSGAIQAAAAEAGVATGGSGWMQ